MVNMFRFKKMMSFLSWRKNLWQVGHDMFRFAQRQIGMDWSEIWEKLTGENPRVHAINAIQNPGESVDFVELANPGNFKEQRATLIAGGTYDVKANAAIDLTRSHVREQVRSDIGHEDPLVLIGAPPCTVFSPMQNINQKHHQGETWAKKYQEGHRPIGSCYPMLLGSNHKRYVLLA